MRLQRELAPRVASRAPRWRGRYDGLVVAGADVSCARGSNVVRAAVVVTALPDFEVLGARRVEREAPLPYIPGLLSFREAPSVIEAFGMLEPALRRRVDAVICDGQGVAHPRGLGLASHIGLWLGLPTVGCAKSRLCGEHEDPGANRGDRAELVHEGRAVGRALRTRSKVKPLYVSVGHLIDVETACELVLACALPYRLPEPTRLAHCAAGFDGADEELLPELRRASAAAARRR
jgi:deoxyribonuclease V